LIVSESDKMEASPAPTEIRPAAHRQR
jgi:hypothetical protein